MTLALHFGYAGKVTPNFSAVQQAAHLVKSDATPVGVAVVPTSRLGQPAFCVVSSNEYWQAAQAGRLVWTAVA